MKNSNKKDSISRKIKKELFKLGALLTVLGAIAGFIYKFYVGLCERKYAKQNKDNPVRRYTCFFEDRVIKPEEGIIEGIALKAVLCSVTFDLRGCEFSSNAFISLKGLMGDIRILAPAGINFKFDGLVKSSSVDNKASDDSLDKTVFVASSICLTSLKIRND